VVVPSSKGRTPLEYVDREPVVQLRGIYWNHPDLEARPHLVRFVVANAEGLEVASRAVLHKPPAPLLLEYLGLDAWGPHFRITNVSEDTATELRVETLDCSRRPCAWAELGSLESISLLPGVFAAYDPSCSARVWERVFGPEMVLRARGKGAGTLLYSDSIDYKATLLEYTRSEHEQSNCTIGELRTSGVGVFERDGVYDLVSADEKGVLEFNAVPEPTGIDIASVDLMLDGSVVGTITDPLPKCPPAPNSNTGLRPECSVTIDFQPLAEGAHQLLWKHRYSGGQQGYLGNCPGKSTLVIDRTPPSLTVNFPHPNEAICPIDGWLDPNNTITDAGSGVQRVCVMLGQDNKCFPNANNEPIRFYLRDLKPGEYPYRVAVWDKVGLSTCTSFRVFVEEQPQVRDLKAVPRVFSPVNTLGRPLFTMVSFVSVSPAQYTAEIRSMADSQLVYASGSDAARNQKIELAWNGTNTAGALVPDGDYKLKVVATSPCGAHDEKTLPSRYDRTPISVDTTPPTITVVAPAPNTVVGAMLEVRGSVWDLHPDRAAVEARKTTECPTCWHEVASVGRDKWGEDEVRLGLWKTAGYEPGDYLVRVVAEDLPGNRAEGEPIPVHLRERRFIDDMSVDPELFSPNADTILDETIISFRLIQSALITLRIINAQGTAVATLSDRQLTTSAGETIMVSWNGKTDTGQVVPDARYAVELVAEDPAQPPQLASESERLSVTTDTLPPALEISSIAENGLYGLSLDVIASHTELHPERWELELGAPTGEATMLATGENRFSSSRLATLDEIADGAYSLELYAADAAGNSNTLTRSFRIDGTLPRVTIESPENGAVVRTVERALELRGTIVEEYLRSYTWSYAAGSAPAENDFATLYQGSETGLDGAVGFDWDASRVTDGVYTIRLQAIDEIGGVGQARVVVTIDNTPPTVAFTSPLDGAMIADPISIVGRAVDAHLESWTLSILDSAGEPQLPPLGQGQTSKEGELAPWAPLPLDSVYTLLLSARDTVGNEAEVRIGVEVASEPPLPPVDLAVKVANKRNAVLTWKPGTGSTPAGYNVYRDNERINTALVVPTTFTDPNLAEGTYSYMVRALSKAGKESADSNTVSVTINVTPPVAKITNPANGTRVSSEQRVVGTAFKEEGFKEYRLWLRAAPAGDLRLLARGTATVLADQLGVWNPAVPPVADGDYDIMLEAEDVYGNVASDTVRVTLDTVAPVAPVLTRAFSYAGHTDLEVDDIQIEWTIDPQPVDLAGFFLYRNGQLANAPGVVVGSHTPYLIADRVYKDEQVPDGTYVYYVTAADAAGNESPASNSSAPIVIETRRPHAEILNPEDGTEFDGMVMIEAIVEDNDVVGVQFDYQPVAGGAWTPLGGPVSSRPYTVPFNPTALGAYRVRATASDGIGPDPAPESITVIATVTVPAPAALVDGGTVTLTWPVLGSVGRVKGLNIYRDGTKLNADRLPAGATSYVDTDVADGSYTYTLTAVDQIDYETKPSPEAVALVTTPRWEFVQPVSSGETKQVWGNGVWAESEVTVERRESSGAYIAVQSKIVTSTSFEFQDLPLVVGFNVLRVRASDAAGNRSKPSADLVLVRATPPASPTNVAGSVQGADVTLSWQVAADSEVLGFPVWRNGSLVNQQIGVRPYNPTTDQLSGSSGALAEFALAVDGNTATSWSPATTPSEAVPAVWQWQWPERRFVDSVLLQWGGNARQSYIDIDVEANGQWLWAYSTQWVYYPGPLQVQISVGLGITGVRVRLPMPATCGSVACLPQLAELRLNTRAWTLASPFVESAVPIGGHKYAVAARNLWGLYSGQAETDVLVGVTPPPPPQNVAAQATADCAGVLVSWQLPVPEPPGLLGFVLWRQEAGVGEPVELAWLEPDDTSYLDRAVAVDRTYRYWLKSTALLGQAQVSSSPSNEAIVTTGCSTPLGPVIDAPTIAGLPITWSKLTTTVGGRALAGAHINLLHDGTQVATGQAIVAQDLFGFELPYYGDYGVYDIPLDVDGTNVIYLQQDYYNYGFRQVSADGTISELITPIGTSQGDLAQSSDGKLIGYVAEDPSGNVNLVLHDLAANEARWLSDDAGSVNTPAFSPDGRYLAYVFNNPATSTSNVRLRDLELGTTRDLLTGAMDQGFWAPTFSPNGQQLLVSAGSVFKLIELATGQVRDLALGTAPRLTSSPFSPDSSAVVFADLPDDLTTTATIWHCELSTGMTRQIGADVGVFAPAFLDQTHVACLRHEGAGDLAAVAYDLATGTAETLQPGLQLSALPFGGGSRWDLTANGSGWFAVPQWQYLYRSETASGRFRFDDVALHVGSNQLVAQQETSGSTQASLPIEVNVPSTLLPDARVEGFAAVPAFPLTNQQVVLGGTIRNAGGRPLEHCAVTLRRVTASGQNESLAHWSIDLAPGQATVLRHTWSSGALPGDSTFWLEIDPDDAIVEGDETNNAASTQVSVRAARAVEVGVTTDRTSYRIGNDMAMAVSFYSNGPATTFNLTTTIEDVAGALVDTVDQRTLKAFGPGSTSYNLTWKVAEIYPADYRVRVVAEGGESPASATAPFVVYAPLFVDARVGADRATIPAGSTLNITGVVSNRAFTRVSELNATLSIVPVPAGTPVASHTEAIANIAAGAEASLAWAWPARVAPGRYTIVLVVHDAGGIPVATSQPFPFTVTEAPLRILGRLQLSHSRREPGQQLSVRAQIDNVGDTPLALGEFTISIVDVEGNQVPLTTQSHAPLPTGQSHAWEHAFATDELKLQPYLVVLSGRSVAGAVTWQEQLATASVALVDLTPPALEVLSPKPGLLCNSPMSLRVSAQDALSGVLRVFYQADGGEQEYPLTIESLQSPSDIYASTWRLELEHQGAHRLAFRAEDFKGNISAPVEVAINANLAPPLLEVVGPEEGACLSAPTNVTFAGTGMVAATLNGQPYPSGQPISADGRYELVVTATDVCGRVQRDVRHFNVAIEAVAAELTFPLEGACAAPGAVPIINVTPTSATAVLTLNGQPYVAGTPIATAGSYTLVVSTANACGVPGPSVTRSFLIDGEAPVVAVTGVVEGSCYGTSVVPSFSATDLSLASTTATLNGQPFTSGATIDREGRYDLVVTATDSCGHTATTTRRFTLSWTPATVEVAFPAEAACARPGVVPVIRTVPDSSPVTATLDGRPYVLGTPISAQGEHSLVVSSADLCGRPGPALTRRFIVDGEPPTVVVTGVQDGFCYGTGVVVGYSATDQSQTTVVATLDGQPLSSGTTVDREGQYELVVTATDSCGQVTTTTRRFTLSWTPAAVEVAFPLEAACARPGMVPVITTLPASAPVTATLDGQPYLPGTQISAQGEHTLVVHSADLCGRPGPPLTRRFSVDGDKPVVTLGGVTDGRCYREPVTASFGATDAHLSGVTATLNGQALATGTTIRDEGDYTLVIEASDACGNSERVTSHFTIDLTPPVITLGGVEDGRTYINSVQPIIDIRELHPTETSLLLDGQAFQAGAPVTTVGSHRLDVTARDCAGNESVAGVSFNLAHVSGTFGSSARRGRVLFLDAYPTTGKRISSWLDRLGVVYTTTTTACSFVSRLRSGLYDTVVVHEPLKAAPYKVTNCSLPNVCPDGTEQALCQQLQDELEALVFAHGSVLLIGDGGERSCLLDQAGALGAAREGSQITTALVGSAGSIMRVETPLEMLSLRNLRLAGGFAALVGPSVGQDDRCDGVRAISVEYRSGTALPRPRRRLGDGLEPAPGDRTFTVASPLLELDREVGNPVAGLVLDEERGPWANLSAARTSDGYLLTITSIDGGALPEWLHVSVSEEGMASGSKVDEVWLRADCSASVGAVFGRFVVTSVSTLRHENGQNVLAAGNRHGLGLGVSCPWDVASNDNTAAWGLLSQAFEFARPEQPRPPLPGGLVPVAIDLPIDTPVGLHVLVTVSLTGAEVVAADGEPLSTEPLTWELWANDGSEKRLTFWVRVPEAGPPPELTAKVEVDDGASWIALEPFQVKIEPVFASRERELEAVRHDLDALLAAAASEEDRKAIAEVATLLAGVVGAPAEERADAECVLTRLAYAYRRLEGISLREAQAPTLRIARLIEAWEAVWSTR
jgi:flagellar hook assembly protein FlgD/WD40 repeat protein